MRRCLAPECRTRIPNRALTCRRHWRTLSKPLRRSFDVFRRLVAATASPADRWALNLCEVEARRQLDDLIYGETFTTTAGGRIDPSRVAGTFHGVPVVVGGPRRYPEAHA